MAVVGDPFLVEVGFALVESPIDGFAVNFGGPLPVGAVELGWVGVAGAVRFAAAVEAGRDAS